MQNIGGPGKNLSDVKLKEFLDAQKYNIKQVTREVIKEEVTPQLKELSGKVDATKAASETAHKEIIERLERLENK